MSSLLKLKTWKQFLKEMNILDSLDQISKGLGFLGCENSKAYVNYIFDKWE